MAFQGNAFQHNAFQTGIPGGGGADPVFPGTRVTRQQDVSGWQEVAGYALLFSSALMPNANTVAAAEYHVGTHQAAVAASQDRSWVRGTPFTLIPSAAGDVILRPTKVAAPEQRDGAYALTFHAPLTYLAVVVPPPSTLVEAPQQIDGAWARTFAPPLSYLARVGPTASTLQAGEQVDPSPFHPPSWVRGTPDTLFPVVVGDTTPPTTWIAAPEQIDGAYALTFRLPLSYLAVVTAPPVTIVVEPQTFDAAYALTFKPATQYLANVRPLAETLVSLNEQADTYRAALTFGPEPPPIVGAGDVRIAGTLLTQVQPDAERPSWVVLLSETLIPAPVIPPVIPPPTTFPPTVGVHPGWPDDEPADQRPDDTEARLEAIRRHDRDMNDLMLGLIIILESDESNG